MNEGIDIIIPWVDGNDTAWMKERILTQEKMQMSSQANTNVRYQSWDNLQYIFRAIEQYMPWVRKIFLVTWGHLPEFLKENHPRLEIVRHEDYIPKDYLPTFNSNVIELNYHRIEGLSENFILFNDDCYPLKPIPETYYFKDSLPCDEAVENPIVPVDVGVISKYASYLKANNILFINRHFQKREVQKQHWNKWYFEGYGELLERNKGLHYWNNFVGFHDYHMPVPLKKSTLAKIWDVEPMELDQISKNQFRHPSDLSQCIVRYWQLCTGEFVPQKSEGLPFLVTKDNYLEVAKAIRQRRSQMICLTEDCTSEDFTVMKKEINLALDEILPEKSSFER